MDSVRTEDSSIRDIEFRYTLTWEIFRLSKNTYIDLVVGCPFSVKVCVEMIFYSVLFFGLVRSGAFGFWLGFFVFLFFFFLGVIGSSKPRAHYRPVGLAITSCVCVCVCVCQQPRQLIQFLTFFASPFWNIHTFVFN